MIIRHREHSEATFERTGRDLAHDPALPHSVARKAVADAFGVALVETPSVAVNAFGEEEAIDGTAAGRIQGDPL